MSKIPFQITSIELAEVGFRLGLAPYSPELEKPEPRKLPVDATHVDSVLAQITTSMADLGFGAQRGGLPQIIMPSFYIPCSKDQFTALGDPSPGTLIALELSLWETEEK